MKVKNYATVAVFALFLFGFSLWSLCKPHTEVSEAERRPLAAMPELTGQSLLDGSFMSKFETYTTDQFPMRDTFRSVKALTLFRVFQQKDMNGLYEQEDYLSKAEYPMNRESLDEAAKKFRYLYETYLNEDNSVYFALVPDKNCYLASAAGQPFAACEEYGSYLQERLPFARFIDLSDRLSLEDYYRTDTHWRQERLLPVAKAVTEAMGGEYTAEFTENTLERPFYGVYAGQIALPITGEPLRYLTSDTLEAVRVTDHETGKVQGIYDLSKADGSDPYEIFLSGSKSLLTLENEQAKTDRRLIVFRDSFGSSLIPLLAENYRQIVVIDIRYLPSQMLGRFVDFADADVLFLYSTLVLNNSITLK